MQNRLGSPVLGILILAIVLVAIAIGVAAVLRIDLWGDRGSGLPSRFSYDLEAFQKTDPAQIGYRETGRISVKMLEPRNVAVGPDDKIYVAGDHAVHIFAPDGQRVRELTLSQAPRAVAIGGPHHKTPGRTYVAMKDHVEVFDAEGNREAVWESLDERALLTSIAAAENDVYVANAGGRVVLRYDVQGKLINRIGDRDDLRHIPGFIIPSPFFAVAVAPDGLLRVTNPGGHRVEAYTPEGDLEQHWGKASIEIQGFCGCCNPVGIAILPNGNVVTAEKGIPRVKVYDSEGEFVCVVAGPESLLPTRSANEETRTEHKLKVVALAVDGHGRVLILDPGSRSVRIFEVKQETNRKG
jgi:sugar lactone lactonase YvrE